MKSLHIMWVLFVLATVFTACDGSGTSDVVNDIGVVDVLELDADDSLDARTDGFGRDEGPSLDIGSNVDDVAVHDAPDVDADIQDAPSPDDVNDIDSQEIAGDTAGDTDCCILADITVDETSDDIDDDIDDVIDDVESADIPVTSESCLAGGNCWIDDACVTANAANTDAPCTFCRPLANAGGWTLGNDGDLCDDGDLCTYDDVCAAGVCSGTFINCEESPPPEDSCNIRGKCTGTSMCGFEYPVGNSCEDGDPCTCNGQCDGHGVCKSNLALCPLVTATCAQKYVCNGSCGCDILPFPDSSTSCDSAIGSGNCDGAGHCVFDDCITGYALSVATPGTCVPKFIQISAGDSHVCGVLSTGDVYCWGENGGGQLGNGVHSNFAVPTKVPGISNVTYVASGYQHTCALKSDGSVWCWGTNTAGQLGNGNNEDSLTPVKVNLEPGVATYISVGRDFSCAIKDSYGYCWGSNESGQLGTNSVGTSFNEPKTVAMPSAHIIECGRAHTCAVLDTGNIVCWGNNTYGQLGLGDTTNRTRPPETGINLGAVQSMDLGEYHSCIMYWGGDAISVGVYCWGLDSSGQSGEDYWNTCSGQACNLSPSLLEIVSLDGWWLSPVLATGRNHTCFIRMGLSVYCAGNNEYGQSGTPPSQWENYNYLNIGTEDLAAGSGFTCGINYVPYSGDFYYGVGCVGRNVSGQLGNGTTENSSTIVNVLW